MNYGTRSKFAMKEKGDESGRSLGVNGHVEGHEIRRSSESEADDFFLH